VVEAFSAVPGNVAHIQKDLGIREVFTSETVVAFCDGLGATTVILEGSVFPGLVASLFLVEGVTLQERI
jgi:hypothetical protein